MKKIALLLLIATPLVASESEQKNVPLLLPGQQQLQLIPVAQQAAPAVQVTQLSPQQQRHRERLARIIEQFPEGSIPVIFKNPLDLNVDVTIDKGQPTQKEFTLDPLQTKFVILPRSGRYSIDANLSIAQTLQRGSKITVLTHPLVGEDIPVPADEEFMALIGAQEN